MLVDGTAVGLVIEKYTVVSNPAQSHDGFLLVELDPKRITGRHRDFVVGVKADELKWGSACSSDDPSDIAVGEANHGFAAAVATTGAAKFKILLPVLRRQDGLRVATNCVNQKPAANFLATWANIFYTGSWLILRIPNQALLIR